MIHLSGHRREMISESGYRDTENYFTVNCCGFEKYSTKDIRTLREKGWQDYQLIYMVRGTGSFCVKGRMTDLPEGSIVIFHPGEMQLYAYQHVNRPELYWVHFTGTGAGEILERVGLAKESAYFIGVHEVLIDAFRKILLELQLKAHLYGEAADAGLLELLALMGRKERDAGPEGAPLADAGIRAVMEQLHGECGRQWSIEEMARQCSLSPNRFMHKFKAQTGLPALDYLIRIRMDKARELLNSSSLSIQEISSLVGYENPLYFSRLFRKNQGISPREYRKNALGQDCFF